MNFIAILGFLFCPSLFAGNSVGNGGNSFDEPKASVAFIQNQIPRSHFLILSWANSLQSTMQSDLWGHKHPRTTPIPQGVEKLFGKTAWESLSGKLAELKIEFRVSTPCIDVDGKETDGAADLARSIICLSGFRLKDKLTEFNARAQVEALILHEAAHLMGADEDEAKAIQNQYYRDIQTISYDTTRVEIASRIKLFDSLHFQFTQMIGQLSDFERLCQAIYQMRSDIGEARKELNSPAASHFSAFDRDELDLLHIRVGQAMHLYVCSQIPSRPFPSWLQEYREGFQGQKITSIEKWYTNRHLQYTKTTAQSMLRNIQDQADLLAEVISVGSVIRNLETNLFRFYDMSLTYAVLN